MQKQINMAMALYDMGSIPLVTTDETDMEMACAFVNLGIAEIERPTGFCTPYLTLKSKEKCGRWINART